MVGGRVERFYQSVESARRVIEGVLQMSLVEGPRGRAMLNCLAVEMAESKVEIIITTTMYKPALSCWT